MEKRDTDGRRIAIRYVGEVGDAHKPSVPGPNELLRLLILFDVYIYYIQSYLLYHVVVVI
jgi:hypothetical protein